MVSGDVGGDVAVVVGAGGGIHCPVWRTRSFLPFTVFWGL